MGNIGFIGGGNMGRAIMEGLIGSGLYAPESIFVYDVYQPLLETLGRELRVAVAATAQEVVTQADTIILAVKPGIVSEVLHESRPDFTPDKTVISIAAGITLSQLEGYLSFEHKVVRVMPNTPALVGEGMTGLTANSRLDEAEREGVLRIFSSFGRARYVEEYIMDAVVGVSGSAAAYAFMLIEALADGAVLEGMSRKLAYEFAAQTILGAAKMVLETDKHPGELKDMVCSPGGTTIAAVKELEERGFRAAAINAVCVAAEKSRNM